MPVQSAKIKTQSLRRWLVLPLLVFGLCARGHAQGVIVPNGVTYVGVNGVGYEIDVVHDPAPALAGGSTTGFSLDPKGGNAFLFDPIADVGVRVFFVSSNAPVSLQPILSMEYNELTAPNNYVFRPGVPVYVGLYTGNQSFAPTNGIYNDPLFGWAELENVGGASNCSTAPWNIKAVEFTRERRPSFRFLSLERVRCFCVGLQYFG